MSPYESWKNTTCSYLDKAFGTGVPNTMKFAEYGMFGSFPYNASPGWWAQYRAKILGDQLTLLTGFIDLLQTEIELSNPVATPISLAEHSKSRKVFVVHGHDAHAVHSLNKAVDRAEGLLLL